MWLCDCFLTGSLQVGKIVSLFLFWVPVVFHCPGNFCLLNIFDAIRIVYMVSWWELSVRGSLLFKLISYRHESSSPLTCGFISLSKFKRLLRKRSLVNHCKFCSTSDSGSIAVSERSTVVWVQHFVLVLSTKDTLNKFMLKLIPRGKTFDSFFKLLKVEFIWAFKPKWINLDVSLNFYRRYSTSLLSQQGLLRLTQESCEKVAHTDGVGYDAAYI